MSLGWRRGLIDIYAFALLNNAVTEMVATRHQVTSPRRTRRAQS